MDYIVFKDVTGEITQRPGELFYKHPGITDEMIDGYLDRGAELVEMDGISHAAAVKNDADTALIAARQKLKSVPREMEEEDATLTRRRSKATTAVNDADEYAKESRKRFDVATKHEKQKAGKAKSKGKDNG